MIEAPVVTSRRCGPPGSSLSLAVADAAAPERPELEAFVRAAFQRRHGATVASFMPTLLSFRDGGGDLRGVIGLRAAGPAPLFLEQYLERPVEAAIAHAAGREVRRADVVEVGNLAGANCRAAMRMAASLPAYLLSRDYRWLVFTATDAVRGILQSLGAPLLELARADATRITAGNDRWGRYYQRDPRVLAGYLPLSHRIPAFRAARHGS